jgi:predicted dehydrogenase
MPRPVRRLLAPALALIAALAPAARAEETKPLKAGLIGLDTSHVVAFAASFARAKPPLDQVRIVAAYPGGSKDVAASYTRVEGYTKTLREKYGVEIVDSVEALLPKVDVVLLESVDGRPHLEQVRPVLKAHKPVFIDKPVAGSLADAIRIFDLAREYGTPCFSSSSLRFGSIQDLARDPKVGQVRGCLTYGPCSLEPHHPDLFWYGVHGVEALYAVMGTGCVSVSRVHTRDADVATGVWRDGRVGSFRGIRGGAAPYGALVFGSKAVVDSNKISGGYEPLLVEIVKFFRTGKPPVSAEETIELFAFMEAADESKRQGGKPVTIESVMAKARAQIGGK